ncbi:MAG: prephenate dehydratase [Gammaproteobacteria bacterium]
MSNDSKLEEIRARIDEVDSKLVRLISERARLATEVAKIKNNEDDDTYYRPEREAQVLRRVIELNEGPLSEEEIARLFREIVSACLALEQVLNIAYLGPQGTFTQSAALKHFGHSVKTIVLPSIDQVFREVESGACHYGVVPIENSIEGIVNHTLDMLIHSSLKICGEVELRIHQHLMSKADNIDTIEKVYSHEQSLAQCRGWLDNHLLKAERVPVNSNAEAAKYACEDTSSAAIAGESAAEYYGLDIVANNIEDDPNNTTRFMVIGSKDSPPCGKDKTSLIFSTLNQPGALHKMLACFAEHNVSLTRIESRPSRRETWDYIFFADVEGHVKDEAVAASLAQLETCAAMVKLLGSYPRAVL